MVKGSHLPEEVKRRISEAHRGKKLTEEHKAKIGEAHRGKRHSGEARARMSELARGRVFTEEHKRKMSEANVGKQLSEETRAKIGKALKGRFAGEKCPMWKGGISFEPYSPEFNDNLRSLVRERDGYICQLCGKSQRENGRRLSVHHIDYNKRNCDMGNLTTLCISCNVIANYNREGWTSYFRGLIWQK